MGWTGIEMDGKITKKAIRETLKSELSSLDIVDVELVKNPNYIRGTDDEKYQLYCLLCYFPVHFNSCPSHFLFSPPFSGNK